MVKIKSGQDRVNQLHFSGRTEMRILARLQHSVLDPPPPSGAEVWSRNTAEFKTRLQHLLLVTDLLAVLGLQGEHPL